MIVICERRSSAPAGAGYFGYGQSSQNHCGPPTCGWQRSRRKKIICFATGLRYGAIGRGICLKSKLFKLRQAPKRRQRMLRNDRGAFFRLRLQAAYQRVRGSLPQAVSSPGGPIRAPVSGGKICTPVSAVTIPRFRRRGERGFAPLPHSEPPYPRLLRNY